MSDREFPSIYLKFEGRCFINGRKRQYWIQDATEDLFQAIEEQLLNNFIRDEPSIGYMKCSEDPESINEFRRIWRNMLNEKHTLVCMTKGEDNKAKLAGFNMLTESKSDDKNVYVATSACPKKLFAIFNYIEEQRNFFEEFKVHRVMKALGLYVLRDYRGEGLGERILDAREYLCRSVGIRATLTAFTSCVAQKLAARMGFQDFYTIEYEELGRINPDMCIPNVQNHTKCVKYMYKLYD